MLSRNSERVLMECDSFDVWPCDFGGGHLVVVFLGGFSSLLYHASDMGGGPMVWPDAQRAVAFVHAHRPLLPRHECDPGPRELG